MNLRLKTTIEMEKLLIEYQTNLQLSTKAAVMRMAIGFSLQNPEDPRINENSSLYDIKAQNGQEYLRYTILGNDDLLFKLVMEEHLGEELSDEMFFPALVYMHIDRGLRMLNSEYRYAKNKDSFFKKILGVK